MCMLIIIDVLGDEETIESSTSVEAEEKKHVFPSIVVPQLIEHTQETINIIQCDLTLLTV